MNRLLFITWTFIFFGVLNVRAGGDEVRLHQAESYMGAGTNQWWLPVNRLERLPQWKGSGDPPLSIKMALKIARKWIVSKAGDGDVASILLRPINAGSFEAKYRYSFFYTIEFSVNPYGNHITCVVLMDGTVVEPRKL